MTVEVKRENGTIEIKSPYNQMFVRAIKSQIGGAKWSGSAWVIKDDEENNRLVRDMLMEFYGEDGSGIETNKVNIRLTFEDDDGSEYRQSYNLFGKEIARAFGRDSGAKIGSDTILESGEITSSGSAKNWYTKVVKGTVLTVKNVNKNMVNEKDLPSYITMEILENKDQKKSLMEEKERLLARLQEIEELLSK